MIAAMSRITLSSLKQDTTTKDNVGGKRLIAGWDWNKLGAMLLLFKRFEHEPTCDCSVIERNSVALVPLIDRQQKLASRPSLLPPVAGF